MTSREATPRPWNVVPIGDENGDTALIVEPGIVALRGDAVLIVAAVRALDAELSNRALIAQLVDALEGVVRVADRKTVEFDKARAALAIGRGEKR